MTQTKEAVQGLSCPRCGGMVPIPEGQAMVICPYCGQHSAVRGERGVRRYQVPQKIDREQAVGVLKGFLNGKIQVARDAAKLAEVSEAFLVHLPFWTVWARGVAYGFGQVQVGSGDNKRYEPREKKAVRELSWNAPAGEVGEFGVRQVSLEGAPLEPFDAPALHRSGMVFEPVGSQQAALEAARADFEASIQSQVSMSQTAQVFTRLVRPRLGLVYYPLWVVRYLYHGRSFQIVVDGFNGQVLYGKAPGSVMYRSGILVGGMALGAFMAIDLPALVLSSSDDDTAMLAIILFVVGVAMIFGAYNIYRHAEHYEYHRYGRSKASGGLPTLNLPGGLNRLGNLGGVLNSEVIDTIRKMQ